MKNSNYLASNKILTKSKIIQNISFLLLIVSINFYSLLVPVRIFASSSLYIAIEMLLLISMIGMIVINILKNPYLIRKYILEISILYVIIVVSVLGTLLLRMNVEINQIIRYLRYLYTPFICSLLVLTSELYMTKLYEKRMLIFIPILSLLIAIVSSIIQLINPIMIRDLMLKNEYYHEMSRSTNFLRGSIHNRLIGVFNDPNLFGAFLTLNILFIIIYLDSKNELKKSVKYIIPLSVILFLTTSRSSIITLFICCIIYFTSKVNVNRMKLKNFSKNTLYFLIVIVLFAGGVAWIFRSLNLSMEILLATRFNWRGITELISFNNRILGWPSIINTFSENLLTIFLGVSYNNFQLSFTAIENTFIGLNFKYGMIVFILIISYVICLLKRNSLKKAEKRMLIGLLFLLGLVSDIDTLLFITSPIFIFLSIRKTDFE